MTFRKTVKQAEAIRLLSGHPSAMLVGGSRSAKSVTLAYAMIVRALKTQSRHLVVRRTYRSTKASLWQGTFPWVFRAKEDDGWSGLRAYVEKQKSETDRILNFPNGSQIAFGGTGDANEVEKLLGTEYSTVWFNECSEWPEWPILEQVTTRLSESSGLSLRAWYDLNPPARSHWSYSVAVKNEHPVDGSDLSIPYLRMNPIDNAENLPAEYIERMQKLKGRMRQRFWLGDWMEDVEGALWTFDTINESRFRDVGEIQQTVVAIDPATTKSDESDETGIVTSAKCADGYRVLDDVSGRYSPSEWARAAVRQYHLHQASAIVAEVNQGGDMVADIIAREDPSIPVRTVRASLGKMARAEPIAYLYERGQVAHEDTDRLRTLEDQMMSWVPQRSNKSPDRVDALVWGLSYLKEPESVPWVG